MSQRITIQIIDKIATCLTELPIVCGNSDYECEFLFDEEWDEHSLKTARFKVNGEYTDVVFEGNICNMPIISNCKIVWIGVFAGELSTSTPAIVHCKPSILDGEDTPAPPREDVYSQIVTMCEEAVETARSVEERANNGEFNGKDGEDGKDAEVDTSNQSNALKGNKQGEVIAINDCSPIGNSIAVKVDRKNFFHNNIDLLEVCSFPNSSNPSATYYGYKIAVPNGTYTLSAELIDDTDTEEDAFIYARLPSDAKSTQIVVFNEYAAQLLQPTINVTDGVIYIFNAIGISGTNDLKLARKLFSRFNIQLEQGTTATAYMPYIEDLSTVEVKACGKNLIRYPYDNTTKTINGIAFTDNGDGSITVNGTSTGYAGFYCRDGYKQTYTPNLVHGKTYTVSGTNVEADVVCFVSYYDANGVAKYKQGAFTWDDSYTLNNIYIQVVPDRTVNNITIWPQIEEGTTATAYEPYKEPITYTVDAEGRALIEPIQPTTTLIATTGAIMQADYNKDINKAYQELYNAIISLGGNI